MHVQSKNPSVLCIFFIVVYSLMYRICCVFRAAAQVAIGHYGQNRQGGGDERERTVRAGPGQQRDPATVQAGVHAVSVVLDLMQPFQALRRRVCQLAKLWLDPLWKIGRRAARLIGRRFCYHSRAGSVGIYTGEPSREDRYATGELERLPAPLIGVLPDLSVARDGAHERSQEGLTHACRCDPFQVAATLRERARTS